MLLREKTCHTNTKIKFGTTSLLQLGGKVTTLEDGNYIRPIDTTISKTTNMFKRKKFLVYITVVLWFTEICLCNCTCAFTKTLFDCSGCFRAFYGIFYENLSDIPTFADFPVCFMPLFYGNLSNTPTFADVVVPVVFVLFNELLSCFLNISVLFILLFQETILIKFYPDKDKDPCYINLISTNSDDPKKLSDSLRKVLL